MHNCNNLYICSMYILSISLLASCTCTDFVNSGGGGNCQEGQLSPASKHNGQVFCYVQQPSNCPDLAESTFGGGTQYSAEACKIPKGDYTVDLKYKLVIGFRF